jgi:MoaA/NifB/PqqE/SkfB family radical SAM enzyme
MSEWKNGVNSFNGYKTLRWFEQLKSLRDNENFVSPDDHPISASVDPSGICNLDCSFCIHSRHVKEGGRRIVPITELLALVDYLSFVGCKSICIGGGGEPTTNPNIGSFIDYCCEKNIPVSMITNGTLLHKVSAVSLRKLTWLGVSLDSASPETYKKIKGRDMFSTVMENVQKISHDIGGGKITVKYLYHPENAEEVYPAIQVAVGLGVGSFQGRPVYLPGIRFETETIEIIEKQIEDARGEFGGKIEIFSVTHKTGKNWERDNRFKKCRVTPLVPTFGSDGKLYICCDHRGEKNFSLCDWYPTENIEKAWGKKKHQDMIKRINVNDCCRCIYSVANNIIEKYEKFNFEFI